MKQMEKILALVGGAKVVFIIPLPRYVLSACCKDDTHVSNRLSEELAAEFSGGCMHRRVFIKKTWLSPMHSDAFRWFSAAPLVFLFLGLLPLQLYQIWWIFCVMYG
jgi:hypothetical protein